MCYFISFFSLCTIIILQSTISQTYSVILTSLFILFQYLSCLINDAYKAYFDKEKRNEIISLSYDIAFLK